MRIDTLFFSLEDSFLIVGSVAVFHARTLILIAKYLLDIELAVSKKYTSHDYPRHASEMGNSMESPKHQTKRNVQTANSSTMQCVK